QAERDGRGAQVLREGLEADGLRRGGERQGPAPAAAPAEELVHRREALQRSRRGEAHRDGGLHGVGVAPVRAAAPRGARPLEIDAHLHAACRGVGREVEEDGRLAARRQREVLLQRGRGLLLLPAALRLVGEDVDAQARRDGRRGGVPHEEGDLVGGAAHEGALAVEGVVAAAREVDVGLGAQRLGVDEAAGRRDGGRLRGGERGGRERRQEDEGEEPHALAPSWRAKTTNASARHPSPRPSVTAYSAHGTAAPERMLLTPLLAAAKGVYCTTRSTAGAAA